MILLDTDAFTLHQLGHERFMQRFEAASEPPAITIITRIEALRGRHDAVFKAEDGARLLRAQYGLVRTVEHLRLFEIASLDVTAAAEFDRLRQTKGLRRIGRGDLIIASICLANKAMLVTRNLRDFRHVSGLEIENWAD
jgi:tRNA(fMet)-specific endonuclease VapC